MHISGFDDVLAVAVENHGLVTVGAATAADIDPTVLRKLVSTGRLERTAHGVYRLPAPASDAHAAYAEAVGWTGDRAVISHESALELIELCDVNPPLIHLTVPRAYAPRRRGGETYRIWRRNVAASSVTRCDGLPVMCPSPAILECFAYGTDMRLLLQACERAHSAGFLTADERTVLEQQIRGPRPKTRQRR